MLSCPYSLPVWLVFPSKLQTLRSSPTRVLDTPVPVCLWVSHVFRWVSYFLLGKECAPCLVNAGKRRGRRRWIEKETCDLEEYLPQVKPLLGHQVVSRLPVPAREVRGLWWASFLGPLSLMFSSQGFELCLFPVGPQLSIRGP